MVNTAWEGSGRSNGEDCVEGVFGAILSDHDSTEGDSADVEARARGLEAGREVGTCGQWEGGSAAAACAGEVVGVTDAAVDGSDDECGVD